MDIIVYSMTNGIYQSQPFQTITGDLYSHIAELNKGIKKVKKTMDSPLKYQLMTMVPSFILNQYLNDVFANSSQAEAVKKLKLDLEWKNLKKELESVEHGSNAENVGEIYKTPDERQNLQHDRENVQCCWNGACLLISMPDPPL
jgi:hypothetical protein